MAEHHGGFSTRLLLLLLLLLRSATYVVDGQTPSAPSTSPVEATFEPTLTLAPSVSPRPIAPVTPLPTSSTVTPTYAPRECWDNFTDMYFDLGRQPAFSTNTYVICPNRTYDIGYKEGNNGDCCANGQLPIVCRANTHFKCGKDGSRSNKCILNGGSDQIVFNEVVFGEELTGVILEGFTFRGPADYTMIGVGGGDVTFLDCLFEVSQCAAYVFTSLCGVCVAVCVCNIFAEAHPPVRRVGVRMKRRGGLCQDSLDAARQRLPCQVIGGMRKTAMVLSQMCVFFVSFRLSHPPSVLLHYYLRRTNKMLVPLLPCIIRGSCGGGESSRKTPRQSSSMGTHRGSDSNTCNAPST